MEMYSSDELELVVKFDLSKMMTRDIEIMGFEDVYYMVQSDHKLAYVYQLALLGYTFFLMLKSCRCNISSKKSKYLRKVLEHH
jgi:hypothetical protein